MGCATSNAAQPQNQQQQQQHPQEQQQQLQPQEQQVEHHHREERKSSVVSSPPDDPNLPLEEARARKQERLAEIDREIRTTHIQLEFASETFDPAAKKFSEKKKELHKLRTQVEEELAILQERTTQESLEPSNAPKSEYKAFSPRPK